MVADRQVGRSSEGGLSILDECEWCGDYKRGGWIKAAEADGGRVAFVVSRAVLARPENGDTVNVGIAEDRIVEVG